MKTLNRANGPLASPGSSDSGKFARNSVSSTVRSIGTASGPSYESTISYSYDAGNRLTQAADSVTGTITRTYDDLNRMTEETTPQGSITYAYDAAGRRTSTTVGSVTVVNYTYDAANRPTQIAQGTPTVSFSYDSANRRASVTLPNSIVMSYTYDLASQLTEIDYKHGTTVLGSLTYSYDVSGRRTNMGGSFAAVNLPPTVSTATYDAANGLTAWGTATLTYDSNGNVTSDGTNSFVWNARNRLASMNSTGDNFQYDAFGRRVTKTIISSTTNYLYDRVDPIQELSGTTVTANLLTGLGIDERFTRTDSSATGNFLTDILGSTILLTDTSASTIASYIFDPFGNTATSGSSTNTYQFMGRESDGTGLYYFRARYYNPSFQRFISEDPKGLGAGINSYAFVADSPTNFVDRRGLDKENPLTCAASLSQHGSISNLSGEIGVPVPKFVGANLFGDVAEFASTWSADPALSATTEVYAGTTATAMGGIPIGMAPSGTLSIPVSSGPGAYNPIAAGEQVLTLGADSWVGTALGALSGALEVKAAYDFEIYVISVGVCMQQ
jgi:RHS repeat-associated protein